MVSEMDWNQKYFLGESRKLKQGADAPYSDPE